MNKFYTEKRSDKTLSDKDLDKEIIIKRNYENIRLTAMTKWYMTLIKK